MWVGFFDFIVIVKIIVLLCDCIIFCCNLWCPFVGGGGGERQDRNPIDK